MQKYREFQDFRLED